MEFTAQQQSRDSVFLRFLVFAWVTITTGILFAVMKKTMGLRVSREEEIGGLDLREHGVPGYGPDATASSLG